MHVFYFNLVFSFHIINKVYLIVKRVIITIPYLLLYPLIWKDLLASRWIIEASSRFPTTKLSVLTWQANRGKRFNLDGGWKGDAHIENTRTEAKHTFAEYFNNLMTPRSAKTRHCFLRRPRITLSNFAAAMKETRGIWVQIIWAVDWDCVECLKSLSMDRPLALLVVFPFGDPHFLERVQRGEDWTTHPGRVQALLRCSYLFGLMTN